MPRGGPLGNRISDPWSYAVVVATFSIPLTALTYWQTGWELALSPVLLGGLIAGYLATHRTGTSAGVGSRAGLLGGLPAVWIVPDLLAASAALSGPPWFLAGGLDHDRPDDGGLSGSRLRPVDARGRPRRVHRWLARGHS